MGEKRQNTETETATTIVRRHAIEITRFLLSERRKRREDIDLADCLQISDKRGLLLKVSGFHDHFDFASKAEIAQFLKNAEKLRDRLAHAQDIIVGSSWSEVVHTTKEIEAFLKKYDEDFEEFEALFGKDGATVSQNLSER